MPIIRGRWRSTCTTLAHKAFFCVMERRLPLRFIQGRRLVKRAWHKELERGLATTQKITVGFGPIISGEHDLHLRKWRIDPIVNRINEASARYRAGIFFNAAEMQSFDLIVIVREADLMPGDVLRGLNERGKILIYDIVDRPYRPEGRHGDDKTSEVIAASDGLIASSPLHIADFAGSGKRMALIEHPVINTRHKDYDKGNGEALKIIWQGFPEHLPRLEALQPIVKRLAGELQKKIQLIYHTRMLPKRGGIACYKTWSVHNWEDMLVKSDIAVEIKSLDDAYLQRKPSTKVITYMAAGLPVVCMPSEADRLVIKEGITGYFATTDEEWYMHLRTLAADRDARVRMGQAGRDYVSRHFNIEKITQKYIDFFDVLVREEGGRRQGIFRKEQSEDNVAEK